MNARTWGYHTLGAAAGVDFPYLLYRDQLGLSVPRQRARPGVRWIRVVTDMPNAVRDMAAGDVKIRDYLRTLRGVDTEAVFSWRDPLPGLYELARRRISPRNGDCDVPSTPWSAVFESSHKFEFFDYFRVPYAVQSEGLDSSASTVGWGFCARSYR